MQLTPNYNLKKPEGTDPVDIQDFNDNADILDAELNKKADSAGGDISNMTIKALEEPAGTQFPIPEAGETSKSFLGKIRKFMNDFKSWNTGVCMIGQIVNNCVTNNDKLPLSAAQGKVLMDLYSVLNTNFDDRSGVTDLFAVADTGLNARRMVRYNANTLHSPFKAGLTNTIDSGLAIITMGSSGNYGTILCIPEGGLFANPCICKKTITWGDWERTITDSELDHGTSTKISVKNAGGSSRMTLDCTSPNEGYVGLEGSDGAWYRRLKFLTDGRIIYAHKLTNGTEVTKIILDKPF